VFGSLARRRAHNLLVGSGGMQTPDSTEERAMLNAISDLSGPAHWPQRPSPRPALADVARYIEANFSERLTLKDLARISAPSAA
jgi:hypothetical protein